MTYKIGQKVETPLGVGTVTVIDKDLKWNTLIAVNIGKLSIDYIGLVFKESDITPYKSAHDKLVEMGFVIVEDNIAWVVYEYKKAEYVIRFCKGSKQVGVYHDYEDNANYRYISLKLSRILTQYLEEMSE